MGSFTLLKNVSYLVGPPTSMIVGLIVGLGLVLSGWRRSGWAVACIAVLETALLSFPPVSEALVEILEDRARAAAARAEPCCYDAIVVLGAGIRPATPPERPMPRLMDGADRLWHAARLYHTGIAPRIIVSGGVVGPANSEAQAMRSFLLDLGVPAAAIVEESQSRNTIENILYVRALVGEGRIALVTSAFHMPRALNLARLGRLNAAAFPADFRSSRGTRSSWGRDAIPSVDALATASVALHELLALYLDRRDSVLSRDEP